MIRFDVPPHVSQAGNVTSVPVLEENYDQIQRTLSFAKSLLDTIPESVLHKRIRALEAVDTQAIKSDLAEKHHLDRNQVTNAFLKLYEILHEFRDVFFTRPLRRSAHFAEFPGSFVFATCSLFPEIDWCLQSYMPLSVADGSKSQTALHDSYGLLQRFRKRILPSHEPSAYGDLTKAESLRCYREYFSKHGLVDFATGDGAIDSSSDYNHQEESNILLLKGQILAALSSLNVNGIFLCKVFGLTFSETRAAVAFLAASFERVTIVKPMTSRVSNSEYYVLCVGLNESAKDNVSRNFDRLVSTDMSAWSSSESLESVSRHMLPFVRWRSSVQEHNIRKLASENPIADSAKLALHWHNSTR